MANRKPLNITKFCGSPDDVPVEKWLRLFDTKADAVGWTDADKVRNFNEYVENDAFKWYLTDVFDTNETWSDVRERMVARFGTPVVDPFRAFIHCRLRKGQTVRQYYDEKKRLGSLAELKDQHIVSGLTDGLPAEMEMAFVSLTVSTPIEWFTVAQRIESSRARSKTSASPRENTGPQQRSALQAPTRAPRATPKSECRICSSINLTGQMHWHSDCPNKFHVAHVDEDQGNASGDPGLH